MAFIDVFICCVSGGTNTRDAISTFIRFTMTSNNDNCADDNNDDDDDDNDDDNCTR